MKYWVGLLILMLTQPIRAEGELLVVVSRESRVDSLTKSEVVDLFMGRYVNFPNGDKAKVFDLAPKSEIKGLFYQRLVNRTEAQIDAYWARLLFSGRNTPPKKTESPGQLIHEIMSSSHAIGYISSQDLTDSLKVVYRFEAL
ncbi:hypothetical protein FM037_03925 [Shewanella psychropiezotolerans]|uniref:Phosphate ABC transporter substrate-binding protein n=1 Tax=Shewanella psychropiezotolerans TaxID=2593655 RepID=A0ABX5WTW3_9GAMM|nr:MULTISPECIES: hypothetical protein [Shewanella]MPY22854.1 hypothetical protein [Shewanella sp. YLB-07]QDO82539.1 hypothetical protein FM037_03925 [Shewanella psychropiezotolerans]